MPQYTYQDKKTGFTKEVWHSMAECDNPSPETTKEITYEGRRMERIIDTGFNIGKFESLPNSEKKKIMQKRSTEHFKKEILDTMPQREKDFHHKKFKNER